MKCHNPKCGHAEELHWGVPLPGCRVTGCTCPSFFVEPDPTPEPEFADINIRLPLDGKAYTFTISGKEQLDADAT